MVIPEKCSPYIFVDKKGSFYDFRQILAEVGLNVSSQTIRHLLVNNNLLGRKVRKIPLYEKSTYTREKILPLNIKIGAVSL